MLHSKRHHLRALALAVAICAALSGQAFAASATVTTLPSIDSVLASIEKAFTTIKDITGSVDVDQVQVDGSVIKAKAKVEAMMLGMLRMTFLEPETFADSIFVFDKNNNIAIQYSPITEQAIYQRIEQVLTDRSIFRSVDQLFSLPSPTDYDLKVIDSEVRNGVNHLLITAKSKNGSDSMFYQFWINQQTWLVTKLTIADKNGKLTMTITLSNIKTNLNLKETTLKKMPPGTQILNR